MKLIFTGLGFYESYDVTLKDGSVVRVVIHFGQSGKLVDVAYTCDDGAKVSDEDKNAICDLIDEVREILHTRKRLSDLRLQDRP